ncbi:sulfurtransferase TusA family protein [Desulforamulus putei]|uniref:TusA-related sulfurtransferase n=1 Tax=Desulforamulus putei DSM 12395 TaxID=1121429 RepID=A0A1M4WAS3_9FIRM|nr:sulfurtransferase TusA family protein [Desulforamulus putei]SHE78183.1 TusA-related sulfurtransferase [Desulforamulus putei DSM 12395]
MKRVVDARGLSCPEPVLLTRQALQEQGIKEITVLVDNKVAVENVTRTAESLGCQVLVTEQNSDFILTLRMN